MGSRRAGIVLTALVLGLAACGDDDNDDGDNGANDQQAVEQDAQAKADARNLTTYVEACFVEKQTYAGCEDSAGSEDVGQARLENATELEYQIVSPSESGNEFSLGKERSGVIMRSCTETGSGGCPEGGEW